MNALESRLANSEVVIVGVCMVQFFSKTKPNLKKTDCVVQFFNPNCLIINKMVQFLVNCFRTSSEPVQNRFYNHNGFEPVLAPNECAFL